MGDWRERPLADLLASAGLTDAITSDLPTDGWSGATFTRLERLDGRRFVLKRTSLARDWIARATDDATLREAWLAGRGADALGDGTRVSTAYIGSAVDGEDQDVAAILMPDLSHELIAWERPGHHPAVDAATLQRVVEAIAAIHRLPWSTVAPDALGGATDPGVEPPWCPLPLRLTLLSRARAASYAREGNLVGERFLAGWDAFERLAPPAAAALTRRLTDDVTPLVRALASVPAVGLHGDLKLANVALVGPRDVTFIDWQMTMRAPVAVDLGWFLVSNSASLPDRPEAVLDAYAAASAQDLGDWDAQVDLAIIVGLLLRGWRKGLDAEAGAVLPSGIDAAADLAWWCERAVAAADRRL